MVFWPWVPSITMLCYGLLGAVAFAIFAHFLLAFLAKRQLNKMLSHIRELSENARTPKTASVRKVHIIANPISGGGQGLQIADAVADLARAHHLPVKGACCNCEQLWAKEYVSTFMGKMNCYEALCFASVLILKMHTVSFVLPVSLTQYSGHAAEFIQDMLPSKDRLIIACGGDGAWLRLQLG